MLKKERVYREILYQVLEKNNAKFTQLALARKFNISLSTVNYAIAPLSQMNAVTVNLKNFVVTDPRKILYLWASIRNLKILFRTRVEMSVSEIEANMPDNIIFSAYSSYKFRYKDTPADYSEIYVYGDSSLIDRFPQTDKTSNLFVLEKDEFISGYGKLTTVANTFVDLWNISSWYAKEFSKAMEERINGNISNK